MTDYAALAAQLGGSEGGDYGALASKLGGAPIDVDAKREEAAKAMMLRGMGSSASMFGRMAPDVAMGAKQVWDAVAQMAGRAATGGPTSADTAANETKAVYDKFTQPDTQMGSDLARGVGQAIVTAPALPALKGGGIIKNALYGGGTGAAGGVLTPVYGDAPDFWNQKLQQAKEGAQSGAVLGAAGGALGKVIAPTVGAAQKALQEADVGLTAGQSLGGAAKGIEDRLAGFPIIGDLINKARFQGINDFNRAVYAKALEPFGAEGAAAVKAAGVGNDGIKSIGDFLSQQYQSVLPKVKVSVDEPFIQSMGELASMAKSLPGERQKQFIDIISQEVKGRMTPDLLMSGESMKAADSALGRIAATYKGSSSGDERLLGNAIRQAQENLRDMVARQNPELVPVINAANQGWRTLVQMENAGAMLGAKDGVFTPAQFLNAVKRSDKTPRDRAFARGDAYNQDFAQAADKVLPNKVPDSGTAGRITTGAMLGGGLEHMLDPTGTTLAATLGVGSMYLPGIRQGIEALLTKRPEAAAKLGDLTKGLAPYLGFLQAH